MYHAINEAMKHLTTLLVEDKRTCKEPDCDAIAVTASGRCAACHNHLWLQNTPYVKERIAEHNRKEAAKLDKNRDK